MMILFALYKSALAELRGQRRQLVEPQGHAQEEELVLPGSDEGQLATIPRPLGLVHNLGKCNCCAKVYMLLEC